VCSFAALCVSPSRVLLRNPTGSAGVGNTTTLPAVRALPDNCRCVHSIYCWCPARLPPAWLQTALRLTLLLLSLFTCQSIRTSSTLTSPELRLHACGSARTLDCCVLPVAAYKCWPAEPQLTPNSPVVAKFCSNPRAHKAEVHYQRGTLVESRPCWQVVPKAFLSLHKPSQTKSNPFHKPRQTPS